MHLGSGAAGDLTPNNMLNAWVVVFCMAHVKVPGPGPAPDRVLLKPHQRVDECIAMARHTICLPHISLAKGEGALVSQCVPASWSPFGQILLQHS